MKMGERKNKSRSSGSAARWVALAFALVVFGIAGIFVVAIIRPPSKVGSGLIERTDATGSSVGPFTGRIAGWIVTVDLSQGREGDIALVMGITDSTGYPAPRTLRPAAALRMMDMAMSGIPVDLVYETDGRWRGKGRVSMSGRWGLQVVIEGAEAAFPFEAGPPKGSG